VAQRGGARFGMGASPGYKQEAHNAVNINGLDQITTLAVAFRFVKTTTID
jgi:hypothetical protein